MLRTKWPALFLGLIACLPVGLALIMAAADRSRTKTAPPPDLPPAKKTVPTADIKLPKSTGVSDNKLPKSTGISERPKPAFDPSDRGKTEELFGEILIRTHAIHREPNPLVRNERRRALIAELDKLKGREVRWRFPIHLSEVKTNSGEGYAIQLESHDSSEWLRPGNNARYCISAKRAGQPPDQPRLIVGHGITEEAFRRLKGGEEVAVEGKIERAELFSEASSPWEGTIRVWIVQARIIADSLASPARSDGGEP